MFAIENPANTFTEVPNFSDFELVDAEGVRVTHTWQITEHWTDAELAAIGVYRVTLATVPAAYRIASYTIQRVAGVVTQVATFALNVESLSRAQFFQQLAIAGIITQAESLAVYGGVIPNALLTLINGLPTDQQFKAKSLILGASEIQRAHPLTNAIGVAYGMSEDQIDAFFATASGLT
jgi:hypothetical protein